jgi:hypothetical protein
MVIGDSGDVYKAQGPAIGFSIGLHVKSKFLAVQ